MAATEVVRTLLGDPTDPRVVHELVAPDATCVSLNSTEPEPRRTMPWAGAASELQAFREPNTPVHRVWCSEAFEIDHLFDVANVSGEAGQVVVFGRLTYRSVTLGKAVTSPFNILATVENGQVSFMQFIEDTCGAASAFRGGEVTL